MSQGRFIELLDRRLMLDAGSWLQELGTTPAVWANWTVLPSGDLVSFNQPLGNPGVNHLMRYSPEGEKRWDIAGGPDWIEGVAAAQDGSIWTLTAKGEPFGDIYVNRYDASGHLKSQAFLMTNPMWDCGFPREMTTLPDGRLVLVADVMKGDGWPAEAKHAQLSNGDVIDDSVLILVRRSGDIDAVIPSNGRRFVDIATTPDNQIIAVSSDPVVSGVAYPGGVDGSLHTITRYADTGMVVWSMKDGSSRQTRHVAVDASGATYLLQQGPWYTLGANDLTKLDALGNAAWHESLGELWGASISLGPDGQVLVAGRASSGYTMEMRDGDGAELWSLNLSGFSSGTAEAMGGGQMILTFGSGQMSHTWYKLKDVVDGILQIPGTPGADRVTVSVANGMVTATMNSDVLSIRQSDVRGIYCTLGDGDDSFTMTGDLPVTVYGNQGNDTIQGGSGADYLHGGQGNDLIWAGAGNDTILGGNGNDRLYGNPGDDSIDAGAGNNEYVRGGTGNDTLVGSYGNSTLCGCDGDDDIRSANARYRVYNSRTVIFGDADNDTITTLSALDRLWGGAGADRFVLPDMFNPCTVLMDRESQDWVGNYLGLTLLPVTSPVLY